VPGPACVADFERLVQPVFNIHCVECHQHVTGGGGLSLQAAGTVDRIVLAPSSGAALNLVQPGRPEESYLYLKVTGRHAEVNGMGARMPLIGARLSDANIETIRAWIEGCSVAPGQG
jgi:mono/diheme cytochrome c family protein